MIMSSRRHHVGGGAGRIVDPANGTGIVWSHPEASAGKADPHSGSRIVAILLGPSTTVTAPGLVPFRAGVEELSV